MSGRMNWRKAKLAGRRVIDSRYEFSEFRVRDAADRWLAKAENRLKQQRLPFEYSSSRGRLTQASSEAA